MKRDSLPPLSNIALPCARRGYRLIPLRAQSQCASPRCHVSPARLWELWLTLVARQPHTKLLAQDAVHRRTLHVQRSRVLRFPDVVRAEIIDLGTNLSSIAIDSRARFGYYDFGVNRRRVIEWTRLLRLDAQRVHSGDEGGSP